MIKFIREFWMLLRQAKRVGAFKRGLRMGMSPQEARAFSDKLYPPTEADRAFEAEQNRQQLLKEAQEEIRKVYQAPIRKIR